MPPAPPDPETPAADHPAWPGDWLRGVLGVCVLHALADGPTYGYALAVRLAEGGLGTIKGGTLYPLLARFEQAGLVDVEWRAGEGGPGRKYYRLTDAGRAELATSSGQWRSFAATTSTFLTTTTAPTPPPEETP